MRILTGQRYSSQEPTASSASSEADAGFNPRITAATYFNMGLAYEAQGKATRAAHAAIEDGSAVVRSAKGIRHYEARYPQW